MTLAAAPAKRGQYPTPTKDCIMRAKKMGRSIPYHYPEPIPMYATRRRNHTMLYVILTVVFIILGANAISGVEGTAESIEQRQYCRMVALHNATPDIGWPDYENRFDADCNADGTVKEVK